MVPAINFDPFLMDETLSEGAIRSAWEVESRINTISFIGPLEAFFSPACVFAFAVILEDIAN